MDAQPLVALLEEMLVSSDTVRYVELNQQFHLHLYRLSGCLRLLTMIEELRNASNAYLHLYTAANVPRDVQRIDSEHREILAACQANDPVRAASAVRSHLQQTVAYVMKELEQTGKAEDRK